MGSENDANSSGQERTTDHGPLREVLERLAGRSAPHARYRVDGEVGKGGQGAILRVWDEDFQRALAMKVELDGEGAAGTPRRSDSRSLGRFLEEAQVTGQLEHPGIVPVHELGLDAGGRVFFTMKLVEGEDLEAIFARVRDGSEGWTQTRALGVLLKICEAVAYAHSKGVIHRDLKPANVMVGRFGEAYVMDWGLARVLGAEEDASARGVRSARRATGGDSDSALVTMDGDIVGTPAYMPPEQAVGDLDAMGPASDVYAIGAVLYELLAGHTPYVLPNTRPSAIDVWTRVREGPPEPLVERAPSAPVELVAICEKAMAREIGDRYPDMLALAEDLRAFLERRVVSAYETGAVAELRKWVSRNRPLALALAGGLAAVVGGALWVQSERAARREDAARVALADAERALDLERGVSQALGEASAQVAAKHWVEAEAALARAEALVRATSDADEGLARIDARRAELERAHAAADFVARIGGIAQRMDVLFDWTETDAEYVRRFDEFGVAVDGVAPEDVVRALDQRGVGAEVGPALDRWLVVRRNLERERARATGDDEDLAGALHLIEIASLLDDDPLRADLREAVLNDDAEMLAQLAEGGLDDQPASTVALLGTALDLAGDRERSLAVLRAGALRRPNDYGLRTTLLTNLHSNPITPEWEREECLEAMLHTQAALSLRPENGDLHGSLFWSYMGLAWDAERRGFLADARALSRAAVPHVDAYIRSAPFPARLLFRGLALEGAGQDERAMEALAKLVREPPPFDDSFGRTPSQWRYWYFSRAGSRLLRHGYLDDAVRAFEAIQDEDTGPAAGELMLARFLRAARSEAGEGLALATECFAPGAPGEPREAYWTAWSLARMPPALIVAAVGARTAEQRTRLLEGVRMVQGMALEWLDGTDVVAIDAVRGAAGRGAWPKGSHPRRVVLGMLLHRIGDHEGALEAFGSGPHVSSAEAYFRALALHALGRDADALAAYRVALAETERDPLSTRGWDDLFDALPLRDECEAALGVARER